VIGIAFYYQTGIPSSQRNPIERIADIKYPTVPAWSLDNKTIAFLWDAAGKQDLFMVRTGSESQAD
jgi:hypothetical protein